MPSLLHAKQEALQREVRGFAREALSPYVTEWDRAESLPDSVVAQLGERGYLGSIFPREYGGMGLGYVEYATLVSELARVHPSTGLFVASHTSLCSNHIYKAGSEEQRRKYLPRLASGEWIGCWSFTEPTAGSDAAGMTTVAVEDADGWVLNGTKRFTTNAQIARVAVVMAVTDPEHPKRRISAFAVEVGTPGMAVGERLHTMGMRACKTNQVHYTNCRVPGSALVGRRGEGFHDCLRILDGGRVSIAALSLGIAQGAYDLAYRYARERRQFGKVLWDFQAIQHKLVDMYVEIEASRHLVYAAARAADAGEGYGKLASMAKLYASEVAVRVADQAVMILAGNGYVTEYRVEMFSRDAKLCPIGEGTSEIQRLVIARELLREAEESGTEIEGVLNPRSVEVLGLGR